MLPVPNLDNYQKQFSDLQRSIANMNGQQYTPSIIPQIQIKYVDGIAGAKEYQDSLPFNSSEIIMDKNEDIFYVVSKDGNGSVPKYLTKGYFYTEQEQPPEANYLTKDDFESFKAEIRELLKGDNK